MPVITAFLELHANMVRAALPLGMALCLFAPADYANASVQQKWQLKEQDDEIATYVRQREGSEFLEARHVATTSARLGLVLPELGDGSACVAWMKRCKSAEVIRREGDGSYLGYVVLNMPWPLSDRDLVYKSTTRQGIRRSIVIEQEAVPDAHPPTRLVRMFSANRFVLTQLDEGGTRIVWEVFSDPGGKVSTDMINSRMYKETREDMLKLLKVLEKKSSQ